MRRRGIYIRRSSLQNNKLKRIGKCINSCWQQSMRRDLLSRIHLIYQKVPKFYFKRIVIVTCLNLKIMCHKDSI